MVEPPQYGGKMSIIYTSPVPTQIWDPIISTRAATSAVLIYGRLAVLDWKKGPSGTNEYSCESSYIPDEFLMGDLAERWERPDTRTCIWYLKKGVRWQNKPPMNGREVIADDIVYAFTRGQGNPQSVFYVGPTVAEADKLKITAVDKYTVKFVGPEPDGRMVHGEGQWLYISPKEVVQQYGNLDNWRNAVGTGPFMVQDVVPDSSVLYKRNPTYWNTDPFHPQNQLPYLDFLEALVILDESTRMAALRTHKVDVLGVPYDKVDSMKQTNPELKWRKMAPDYGNVIFMRTDIAPFSDKRVRQALQYAVDEPRIKDEYFKGDAIILGWPVQPFFKTHYTPLAELPENLRQMYEYQPETAKKLLAEAGYPNGFKTEVGTSAAWAKGIEHLSIVKENWKTIGVDLEIKPIEAATYGSLIFGKKFPAMAYSTWGNNGVDDAFGWAHDGWVGKGGAKSVYAFSSVNDPVATETYVKLMDTLDFNERERIRKEENVREIDLVWEIAIPIPSSYVFWAPWLKGYSGEMGVGPDPPEWSGVVQYLWIDKALRSTITGIKE
jgi:peptide/nickel transport system substrate-binding protein